MSTPIWIETLLSGKELTVIFACYCLGCLAAGYYWVRWRTGLDIRRHGSGNVGARNVGRLLGPPGFLVTLLFDVTKGALAVAAAVHFRISPEGVIAAMLAVVAGHTWPCQLQFKGGKGIATSLGAILAYDPLIALIMLVLFLPTWVLARSFTLSGLLAMALSPALIFLVGLDHYEVAAMSFLSILVLLTHRKNIREELARHWVLKHLKNSSDSKHPRS